jgi:hypothetical protein
MRKFIVSNPEKFKGNAEVYYNDLGTLCKIDVINTDMEPVTVSHFKQAVPATVGGMINGSAFGKSTTVIEGDFVVTFNMFWEAYCRKFNKKRCEPLWNKLDKVKQVKAYYGIAIYDKFLSKSGRFKCDPENYLRNELWENEYR